MRERLQEARTLGLMLDNHGWLVPLKAIHRAIWPDGPGVRDPELIRNHRKVVMHRVRRRLEAHGMKLQNIRGCGYIIPRPLTTRPQQ
jgi:DNA-binding response OmpR family regulator